MLSATALAPLSPVLEASPAGSGESGDPNLFGTEALALDPHHPRLPDALGGPAQRGAASRQDRAHHSAHHRHPSGGCHAPGQGQAGSGGMHVYRGRGSPTVMDDDGMDVYRSSIEGDTVLLASPHHQPVDDEAMGQPPPLSSTMVDLADTLADAMGVPELSPAASHPSAHPSIASGRQHAHAAASRAGAPSAPLPSPRGHHPPPMPPLPPGAHLSAPSHHQGPPLDAHAHARSSQPSPAGSSCSGGGSACGGSAGGGSAGGSASHLPGSLPSSGTLSPRGGPPLLGSLPSGLMRMAKGVALMSDGEGGGGGKSKSDKEAPNRKEWAAGEDELILEAVRHLGCKWRVIASMLPGRSDDAVRNRWNRLKEPSLLGIHTRDGGTHSSAYRCSKCGQPKKNHRCTWVPPPAWDGADEVRQGGPSAQHGVVKSEHFGGERSGVYGGGEGGGGMCALGGMGSSSMAGGYGGDGGGADATSDAGASDYAKKEKAGALRVGWTKAEDETITASVAELGHKWYQISERLPGRTDHAIRNRWHRLLTMRQDASKIRTHSSTAATAAVEDDVEELLGHDGLASTLAAFQGAMDDSNGPGGDEDVDLDAFINQVEQVDHR